MSTPKPTGYVRQIQRATGPVYYAHIRTSDGRRLQRKLGPAWLARSRPPHGHLTRAQAEVKLAEILAGENPTAIVAPTSGATFTHAAREWLRYVEHDRSREHSTVLGYRTAVESRLLPKFGHLPLEAIDRRSRRPLACRAARRGPERQHDQQTALVRRSDLQARSARLGNHDQPVRPRRAPASAPARRLQRARAHRDARCWPRTPPTNRTPRCSSSRRSPACGSASCARCGGATSTSPTGSCTSAAPTPAVTSSPTRRAAAVGRCR